MNVIYSPRALRDIDEVLYHIQQRSPRGARNLSLAIERTIDLCALNPRAGSVADEPDLYRRTLGKYRYTVFYRTRSDDSIEIARVIHSARVKDLGKVPEGK